VALGVPAGQGGPAEQPEDRQHLHAGPDVDHAVLAVGGEHEVVRPQGPGAADLGRLLAQAGRPDAELALALEVVALDVDATDDHELAVQVTELVVAEVGLVGVVLEERPIFAEQSNLLVGLVHASVSRVVAPTALILLVPMRAIHKGRNLSGFRPLRVPPGGRRRFRIARGPLPFGRRRR
jgi:hypothetical protein